MTPLEALVMGRFVAVAMVLVLLVAFMMPRPSRRALVEQRARSAAMSAELREGVLSRSMLAGLPKKPGVVRGVVMDWNLGEGVATLVAIDDGSVSLYMGAGGGILGAGTKPSVAAAARRFLDEAERVRGDFDMPNSYADPGKDSVRFYLLTDDATLVAPSIGADTPRGTSALAPLNDAAQSLIAAIRKAS